MTGLRKSESLREREGLEAPRRHGTVDPHGQADVACCHSRNIMDRQMLETDSFLNRLIFRNGAILLIPPMAISFGLWSMLPSAFGVEFFWKDIPKWLGLAENISRIIVFALPAFLFFGIGEPLQKRGWILYASGIVLYFLSYLLQIYLPESLWSNSIIGFTAPAWTTIFWLSGIGLVCGRSWLPIPWSRLVYIVSALLFLLFHICHVMIVFSRK
jgi:hypothetical protein